MNDPKDILKMGLEISYLLDNDDGCPPEVYNALLDFLKEVKRHINEEK